MREGVSVRKWMLIAMAVMILLPGCTWPDARTRLEHVVAPVTTTGDVASASSAPAATSSPTVDSTPAVVAPDSTSSERRLPIMTAVPKQTAPSAPAEGGSSPSVTASPKADPSPTPSPFASSETAAETTSSRCSKPEVKCIALTFDDGPGPYTSQILDALDRRGAKATFFVLGSQVHGHEALLRRMMSSGMEIGNHTWSHSDLARLGRSRQIAEINDAGAVIERASGQRLTLVRPPYGSFSATTRSLGVPLALWSVDTLDWKHRSSSRTVGTVKAEARAGAVVLMHDIHSSTVDAAARIIDQLRARGFTLVTVSHLHAQ